MAAPTTTTELLKTQAKELVKSYIELDLQSRPWKVYDAHTDAVDGDQCVVTEYGYLDASSTVIIKRKEYYGTWVSATMDI